MTIRNNSILHNKLMERTSIFTANEKFDEVETYEVILRKRKTKKNGYKGFNLPMSYDLLEEILTENREDIEKFRVSQDKMSKNIDLLSDKFVNKVTFVKEKNRAIDSKNITPSFHWKPGDTNAGNLKGTFRTLDGYDGDIFVGNGNDNGDHKPMPIEDGILSTDGWT